MPGGPWITSALFCEAIDKGTDGLGIIRGITNHVDLKLEIEGDGEPSFNIVAGLRLALGFAPDEARGRAQIRIDIEGPDGITHPGSETSTRFLGPDQGDLIDVFIETNFTQEGLHWFNVLVDGALLTRVPFRVDVHITRYPAGTHRPSPAGPRR